MGRFAAGKLLSGFAVGAAIGAGAALLLSSRANVAMSGPRTIDPTTQGPTPFEPANLLIARARTFVEECRMQLKQAMDEGKATAQQTRLELTARFEAAKHAEAGHETH